jgi:CRISPR system Cascade subunit CasD
VTAHLVFTLAAPFGSFCDTASSATMAHKPTRLEPTCSALVGLLGAALGEPRERLADLAAAWCIAVRTGVRPRPDPKPDYHTITPPRAPEGRQYWTRFEELRGLLSGGETAGSIQSRRAFWSCGLWTVSIAARERRGPAFEVLESALKAPRYPLYVGRKAYPLGLPPDPQVIDAPTVVEAHTKYGWPWTRHHQLVEVLGRAAAGDGGHDEIVYHLDYPGAPKPAREEHRNDVPDHRIGASGALIRGFGARRVGIAFVLRGGS